ncbi:MAG: TIGR02757 family protein [Phycisphaerales bacterium]
MTGAAERPTGSGRSSSNPQRRWPRARRERERAWLEDLYAVHHDPRFIDPDPLQYVRCLPSPADREVAGLVASALAYGNVTAMRPAIETVLAVLGKHPAKGLDGLSDADLKRTLADFRYRVTPGERVAGMLIAVRRVRGARGSLEDCILAGDDGGPTIVAGVAGLVEELRRASPTRLDHLLPAPRDGSACKRLMLWLRWMVRCDAIDPGGWDRLDPARLVMPIDTHVYRTARERRWTRRRTVNLSTALEITERLSELEPSDPLRWDFSITRPGIRGEGS